MPLEDPSFSAAPLRAAAVIRCLPGVGEAGWLRSGDWSLYARPGDAPGAGRTLVTFTTGDGRELDCTQADDGTVTVPFGLADAFEGYARERWAGAPGRRRLSPRALAVFYALRKAIPRRAQLAGRRALIRWQGEPAFPAWPFDDSMDTLLRFYARCALTGGDAGQLRFRWFWPRRARAAAILTHDVESEAGLRNAPRIADLEQERGLRSSFNIVAGQYPVDSGIVAELQARGFEVGVHGIHHDRSLFSGRAEFERQLPLLREAAARFAADGFRSPATHRNHDWIPELPFSYDCTVPASDPYEPQPGGCCSYRPYFLGEVVELPYTLPQDHLVFTLLKQRTIEPWLAQLERIEARSGLIQCLSHPDPGYLGDSGKEALYCEFLDAVAERKDLWRALPRDVAAWWRARDSDVSVPPPGSAGLACLGEDGSVALGLEPATG